MFYYLFGWEMRHLHTGGSCPVVSGQGCVIMTSIGPSLGMTCPVCGSYAQFFVLLCNFEENQLFCAPILYRYIIIKLYNNTRFSVDCCQYAFASGAPPRTPLGGLQRPPRPPAGKDCIPKKVSLIFFFPLNIMYSTIFEKSV